MYVVFAERNSVNEERHFSEYSTGVPTKRGSFSLIILQVSATMEAAGCGWSEGEIAQRVGVVFEQRGQHRGALVIVLPGSR